MFKKLKTKINAFKWNNLTKKAQTAIYADKVLHEHLEAGEFFPSSYAIDDFMHFLMNLKDARNFDNYSMIALPLHTQDPIWLQGYITHRLEYGDLEQTIDPVYIKQFVLYDPYFARARDEYEQKVVINDMKNLLQKIKDVTIEDRASAPYQIRNSMNAVEHFFKTIEVRSERYGFNQHNIELTLENYSALWRPEMANLTFRNQFIEPLIPCKEYIPEDQYLTIIERVYGQRKTYQAIQEYDYYKKHNKIIDELGTKTDNMRMKPEEVAAKRYYLRNKYLELTGPLLNNVNLITDNQKL